MELNESQKRAVSFYKGPYLVLAGPGSGKTFVITTRVKNLIEYYHVPPEKILVATFSRAAANEMKERYIKLSNGCGQNNGLPTFGTFHSIFFMILKASYNYDSKSIIADNKKYDLIRSEVNRLNIFYENENDFFQSIVNEISLVKNNFENVSTFKPSFLPLDDFISIYNAYEKSLRDFGLIDYDDMMNLCYRLLKDNPKILKHYQNQFAFILIDEFQDINPIQYKIMKMLAAPHNNIFIVGDDDQSIYGFRGSSPLIMKQFAKDFPSLKHVLLDTNYRSTSKITSYALKVISKCSSRFKKIIKNAKNDSASVFQINKHQDLKEEYTWVAHSISSLINNGCLANDIAILIRSSQNLSLLLDILDNNNIPVLAKNKSFNIFKSFIFSDIIAYLKIAYALAGKFPNSNIKLNDFVSIMNKPSRYISRNTISALTTNASFDILTFFTKLKSFYSSNSSLLSNISKLEKDLLFMGSLPLYAAIQYLVKAVKYNEYLREISNKNHKDIHEYLSILEQIKNSCLDFFDLNEWLEFINDYGERLRSSESGEPLGVNILTMHASKGLEFETVYILDVNEGVIPHIKCTTKNQIEEECRLLYVAMTRAKTNLYLSYVENIRSKKVSPSRFIAPLISKEQ